MGPKSQKKDQKSTKPLKVLAVYSREEPSPAKPFLSSVQQKKVYKKPLEFVLNPTNY
jgi:hypothetical protein